MSVLIPKNSPTATLRRIYFTLVDATDLFTPEDITVTGVKANLSFNGAASAASTNDIVKVSGTNGEYYVELTQAESNTGLGTVRGWLQPTGCALTKFEGTVGPLESYDSPTTTIAIASGGITSSSFATDAIDAAALAASAVSEIQAGLSTASAVSALPTATQIADAFLARNQKGGSNTAPTVADALASGLMSIVISGGTMTVKNGDGTTAFTRTVSRSALDSIVSLV